MIHVIVRVNDIFNGLAGEFFHLRHNIVAILREFIVHQHHAFAGHHGGGVARHKIVVNHIQVVRELHGIQLCRRVAELRVGHPKRARQTRGENQFEQRAFTHGI